DTSVDAVMDNGRRTGHIASRRLARRNDRVHPRNQEVREPGVAALGGRIEDERKPIADELQKKPSQHFDVPARMPDADRMTARPTEAQPHKIAQAQPRDSLRMVRSKPGRSPAP